MKKLTDKQKVEIFEKEGYSVFKIGDKYEVCQSMEKFLEWQNLINEYYLHKDSCCKVCKKKIYNQRRKICKRQQVREKEGK